MGAPTGSTIYMKNSWHWQSQAERWRLGTDWSRWSSFLKLNSWATWLHGLQVFEDEEQEHKDRERLGSANTRKRSEKIIPYHGYVCLCGYALAYAKETHEVHRQLLLLSGCRQHRIFRPSFEPQNVGATTDRAWQICNHDRAWQIGKLSLPLQH